MYDQNNIFAKIIRKESPAKIVFENDDIMAFHTISPMAKIHVVVIPKGYYIDYQDFIAKAPTEIIVEFFKEIDKIASLLNIGSSYKIVSNKGAGMGQEIYHFHIHLMGGGYLHKNNKDNE